jgi:hypothetical protein
VQTDGYRLDKSHVFRVNMFDDFEKYSRVPEQYTAREVKPYEPVVSCGCCVCGARGGGGVGGFGGTTHSAEGRGVGGEGRRGGERRVDQEIQHTQCRG